MHFALDGLLPDGHMLALNLSLGTLSLIANSPTHLYPDLLAEQQFTTTELCVLLPLLKAYPHYCPYEVLLASFNHGNVNEASVDRSWEGWHEARVEESW